MNEKTFVSTFRELCRPWTIIISFLGSFLLLAWLGRTASDHDWHRHFGRFHPMIAPESMYQPTMGEMRAIVRSHCRKDQILVIVGGNSILLGVGQPADKMWTRRLQALLGPHYAVVNLAFRGASATDGGALVAESLRTEFPHQIYIANAAALQGVSSIGLDSYRFMMLDAYYKKMLLPWPPRDEAFKDLRRNSNEPRTVWELELGAQLDAWLHFRDFWNRWSYIRFFTFATTMMPEFPQAYWPRVRFDDEENDYDDTPFETRFSPTIAAADLNITRRSSEPFYRETSTGDWQPIKAALEGFVNSIQTAFPTELRQRTLILIGRNSAFYLRQLDRHLLTRDDLAFRDCVTDWNAAGYHSIEYGKDFDPEDYGDRSHLTSQGGQKLAAIVAPEIESIARQLGYINP